MLLLTEKYFPCLRGKGRYICTKVLYMKKIAVALGLVVTTVAAQAQQQVSIDSLRQHIGDSVTVCTKIFGGIYLERSNGTPTLLNAGAAYPNSPLTIMIGPDARSLFKEAPETFYKDKNVCITGKVILYKEKPEIIIYQEKQIEVK